MIITEADLRDQLRRPTLGAQVTIPAGAKFSPSAADFVKQWALVAVEQDAVASGAEQAPHTHDPDSADWDKASVFPVNFAGDLPSCLTCGTPIKKKPSALTQLDASHYAPKTHPRIKLRGRVDSLHALALMAQRIAKQDGRDEMTRLLGTVAAYCRELTSAEYNERPVADLELPGWPVDKIHQATHNPDATLGIPHLTIDEDEPELQHWLNMARTMAREIEVTAMEAFPSPHHPYGASICHAFNRLSSTFYFLQLLLKSQGAA